MHTSRLHKLTALSAVDGDWIQALAFATSHVGEPCWKLIFADARTTTTNMESNVRSLSQNNTGAASLHTEWPFSKP